MLYNAKNKSVLVHNVSMSYVEFGSGTKTLVLLPGLVDGLRNVKGQALNLALFYREFTKDFKVYIFSRKDILQEDYSIEDMATDLKIAFTILGIEKCYLLGASQGGMIAQRFAIEYPDIVEKLIIAVSASRTNSILQNSINCWIDCAEGDDYKSLIIDTMEKTYSPKRLKIYRLTYPVLTRIGKPKDFIRFLIQARACLAHNTYNELERINCPTMIIGGDDDKVVGINASLEMAKKIKNSQLVIYEGLGHAVYEEAKGFNIQVIKFLLEEI